MQEFLLKFGYCFLLIFHMIHSIPHIFFLSEGVAKSTVFFYPTLGTEDLLRRYVVCLTIRNELSQRSSVGRAMHS